MRSALRRLRGIAGLGFSWATVWTLGGTAFGAYNAIFKLSNNGFIVGLRLVVVIAALFGLYGFISGSVWSVIFAIAERRQTLRSLSTGRVAVWGAVGGALVPTVMLVLQLLFGNPDLWHEVVPIIVVTAWLGAGCAAATVSIARRADNRAAVTI